MGGFEEVVLEDHLRLDRIEEGGAAEGEGERLQVAEQRRLLALQRLPLQLLLPLHQHRPAKALESIPV